MLRQKNFACRPWFAAVVVLLLVSSAFAGKRATLGSFDGFVERMGGYARTWTRQYGLC